MSCEREIIEQQIKDHQKAIDDAKKKLAELDIIRVPDGIVDGECNRCKGIGIIRKNQKLYWRYDCRQWKVACYEDKCTTNRPCKLTPCKYEDLKDGDVFYRSGYPELLFKNLEGYAIKIGEKYICWQDGCDIRSYDTCWEYYWKVEVI